MIIKPFLPNHTQKKISEFVAKNVDLAISNLPGPIKPIYYMGCKVTDFVPVIAWDALKVLLLQQHIIVH